MKKFLMVLCCLLTFGFILAGCSPVSMPNNSEKGIVYTGKATTAVSNYLYYGNVYSDTTQYGTDELDDYNAAKKTAYLARLDTNLSASGENMTPKNAETVLEEVIATENQFMFAIGDYIYYLKSDEQKYFSGETSSYKYSYMVLCSMKLDGSKQKELYNFENTITEISALEYNGGYYVVAFATDSLHIIKLSTGNGKADATKTASSVTSASIPQTPDLKLDGTSKDWNGYVYYTTDEGVNAVSVENPSSPTKFSEDVSISFKDRVNDIVIFADSSATYYSDASNLDSHSNLIVKNEENKLTNSTSIEDVHIISATSDTLRVIVYKDGTNYKHFSNAGSGIFTVKSEDNTISDFSIMFVDDRLAYIQTATDIFEVDFAELRTNGNVSIDVNRSLVTLTEESMLTGKELFGYDGTYIYFYAKLQPLTEEEREVAGLEAEEEEGEDSNYYLYRVHETSEKLQLMSKTTLSTRTSK